MRGMGWGRRVFVPVGVAAAVIVLTAANAAAATTTGFYFQSTSEGATFQVLRTNNLVKGQVDDALFALSTTGTGLHRLPFPLHLYNQTYKNVVISSNGNIQAGVTLAHATRTFANTCLPSAAFAQAAVLPYWDDLFFDSAGAGTSFPQGIFLRTAGTAPHRTFTVSWQGVELAGTRPEVLAQAVFTEGSQNVAFVYGTFGGASATIGIQARQQLTDTQFSCDPGLPDPVSPGTKLSLQHTNVL